MPVTRTTSIHVDLSSGEPYIYDEDADEETANPYWNASGHIGNNGRYGDGNGFVSIEAGNTETAEQAIELLETALVELKQALISV